MAKKISKKNTDSTATVPPVSGASTDVSTTEAITEPTPAIKRALRKPSLAKVEPRANLVPINLEQEIRRLAYLMSERRGFTPGHETEDWLAAEHEVLQRYHQHSA